MKKSLNLSPQAIGNLILIVKKTVILFNYFEKNYSS
jgi:hypothetical protein